MFLRLRVGSKKAGSKEAGSEKPAPQSQSQSILQLEERDSAPGRGPDRAGTDTPKNGTPKNGAPNNVGPLIKTYVAASVSQAMLMARRELGDEAILIQTTPKPKTESGAAQYEVTFGVIPGAAPAQPAVNPALMPEGKDEMAGILNGATSDIAEVSKTLAALQREVAALHSLLAQSTLGKSSGPAAMAELSNVYTMLVRHNLDPDLATDLVRGIQERIERPNPAGQTGAMDTDRVRALLAEQLRSRVRTDETLGSGESARKPVLLVGPPAVGKTATLIKLAVEFGFKRGKQVEIHSVARFKAEVNRALESMTALLNIPYRVAPSVEVLAGALSRPRAENSLVLVDTSGYGSGPIDEQMELASFAQSGNDVEVHLTLPATWHAASIRQAVDRFEIFQPSHLLFTMLDQTAVYGAILQEAWRTGKPLSYFASGPLGAGSVSPASLEQILALMWESRACDSAGAQSQPRTPPQ